MKSLRFEITKGPHAGKQGDAEFIYYDHLHTGNSADLVDGPLDTGEGRWRGTTEWCRVFEEVPA